MSWQSYVDDHMVATGHVAQGAIFGLDGSQWAISAGLNISAAEATAIINAAKNPSSVMGSGITVAGNKYMVLRGDENSIYMRKGSDGVCLAKTNQAVLVGVYNEKQQAGMCNTVVEKLADYLKETGY